MKKIYLLLLAFCITFSAFAQDVLPKLSPGTKSYLSKISKLSGNENRPDGFCYKKRNDGKLCVSAIIQINKPAATSVQNELNKLNASVGTKAGIIWTVQVPYQNVTPFTKIKGIRYIQVDEPVVMPQLDSARKKTKVDSAHTGYGLPNGYSGKGVLVGIIDFGFDYNHPTMYDTSGNKYRIIKAWEMNGTGTAPAGYTYGNEIADTNLLKARGTDNPAQIHGSGVAGLASGSGFGSAGLKYKGIAYESEMVFVGVRRDSIGEQWMSGGFSDFIDGVNYLTQYATSVSKPIVVNISWGSQSGPHDGSSLVNQAFDALTGNGKIIVMSGGNNGNDKIYLNKTFTATDTILKTYLTFTRKDYQRTWIDIWGDTSETFCVKTSLFSKGIEGSKTKFICIDNTVKNDTLISANGLDTCFVETITMDAEYNMKPRIIVNIYNKAKDSVGLSITGKKGSIDLWDEYYYYGFPYGFASEFSALGDPTATAGNTNTTISDMGAGLKTLLVASHNSRNSYYDLTGTKQTVSGASGAGISYYSSKGPYLDGRIKPDIAAPGNIVISAMNSWDMDYSETGYLKGNLPAKYVDPKSGRSYYYGLFNGTSAASPMAAGIVALLLQRDPTLSPEKVKTILFETAIQDTYTGSLPAQGTNTWGHGKINAYAAVRKLSKDLSVATYSGTKKLDCVLFPNPNNGTFNLDLIAEKSEALTVSVVDITGKMQLTQTWKVDAGQNNLPLNLSAFSKGIYFVKIQSIEGSASIKAVLQ